MEETRDADPESELILKEAFDELCSALAKTNDTELIADFLTGLLTATEKREVSARWALVREIDAGTTQREIARKMRLSLCKITRGSKELKKENSPFKRMIDLHK